MNLLESFKVRKLFQAQIRWDNATLSRFFFFFFFFVGHLLHPPSAPVCTLISKPNCFCIDLANAKKCLSPYESTNILVTLWVMVKSAGQAVCFYAPLEQTSKKLQSHWNTLLTLNQACLLLFPRWSLHHVFMVQSTLNCLAALQINLTLLCMFWRVKKAFNLPSIWQTKHQSTGLTWVRWWAARCHSWQKRQRRQQEVIRRWWIAASSRTELWACLM